MKSLVIIGASGHGKVVADTACQLGYKSIVFLDDCPDLQECAGFPVVGAVEKASSLPGDSEFVVAIGNARVREAIQEDLVNKGRRIATIVSPQAYIGRQVNIGNGCVFMAGAIVNSGTTIGDGCIVNTGATIDHDCIIGDYAHVSVGAHVAGTVNVGRATWIGAGAIVINNVYICSDCVIGAGAVVIRNIDKPGTYVGVPATSVKNSLAKESDCGNAVS